jgi:hypothetical protein
MPAVIKHIIEKQVLEVEIENPPDSFGFRNQLGEVFHTRLYPELDKLFSELAGPDKLIRIEHITIDLGEISGANWEQELRNRTVSKLKEALLLENPIQLKPRTINLASKTNGEDIKSLESNNSHAQFFDVFCFFLHNGYLPWYAYKDTNLEVELLRWIKDDPSFFKTSFVNFIQSINTDKLEAVLHRFTYQLQETTLNEIINFITPERFYSFWQQLLIYKERFVQYYDSISLTSFVAKKINHFAFFKTLASKTNNPFEVYYFSNLIHQLQKETCKEGRIIIDGFKKLLLDESFVGKDLLQSTLAEVENIRPLKPQAAKEDQKKKNTDIDQDLFIKNAGLILLNPFLQPLFKELRLLNKDNFFISLEEKMRAVLLTEYIATGELIFEEHQLVLNKLLCGYTIGEPIISELIITEEEIKEVEDLLNQVIQNWRMNGSPVNSTIEGFRTSFLQREGKLKLHDTNWKLQVEQKTYDMVLSSLPWGIGIIKNCWMEGLMYVDWA